MIRKSVFTQHMVTFQINLNIYLFAYSKHPSEKARTINNLIAGFGIYFIFSSLIIAGIYNIEDFYMFIVGALLFFRNEDEIENGLKEAEEN